MKNKFLQKALTLVFLAFALICTFCGCNQGSGNSVGTENTETTPAGDSISSAEGGTSVSDGATESDNAASALNIGGTDCKNLTEMLYTDKFIKDGSFITYTGGGVQLMQGTDVSDYSGEVDFADVKNSGIDFVIVRLGGRGYGDEGALYKDDSALENIRNAKSAGLKVGAYFFSQAVSADEAAAEAEYAASLLQGEALDFPLAFDWEEIQGEPARTDGLSGETVTLCARAFCDGVKRAGYIPMIYAKSEVYLRYDLQKLGDIDFWYAEYSDAPSQLDGYTIWQYSESASIAGIESAADLNLCFVDY